MKFHYLLLCIIVTAVLITAGCDSNEDQTQEPSQQASQRDVSLNGAGASFPFPIYSQWAFEYEGLSGTKINYQSVGSGAGISAIQARTVDFGASDAPLEVEDLDEFGLVQFPMVIGGVIPVINIEGIESGEMKFSTDVLAGIFLGNITSWNDVAVTSINPGLDLPDTSIGVVHRADGSGTTWIFSSYMSAVSDEWAEVVGTGKSLEWPIGIGGRGNEGVANFVSEVDGSIGYVEYAYVIQNEMTWCSLENKDGHYAEPNTDSFMAAAAYADWENAPGYYLVLVDQPGEITWPIVGASFILIYKEQENREDAYAMLEFFDWCFTYGKSGAVELDYIPIPENVVDMIGATWGEQVTCNGESIWPTE